MVCKGHMINKNHHILAARVFMASKFGRMIISYPLRQINLLSRGFARSRGKLKLYYIITTKVPMTSKVDRMVIYLAGLLLLKSFNALILLSCKVTWQKKPLYHQNYSVYGLQI